MHLKKDIVLLLVSILLLASCRHTSCERDFAAFIAEGAATEYTALKTAGMCPDESLPVAYRRIITDTENADYLLEKALSDSETRYCIPNIACPLTEGDVALCMLLDMYMMPDAYFDEYMYAHIENREYGNVADFWNFVHESIENRTTIIHEIERFIELKISGQFPPQ